MPIMLSAGLTSESFREMLCFVLVNEHSPMGNPGANHTRTAQGCGPDMDVTEESVRGLTSETSSVLLSA